MGAGLKRARAAARATRKTERYVGPTFPIVIETFREFGTYEKGQLSCETPSCFNGKVSVRKYRITVENIDEPVEVIWQRLLKLWRESDNHHDWEPLRIVAKRYGLALDTSDFGKDRKRAGE